MFIKPKSILSASILVIILIFNGIFLSKTAFQGFNFYDWGGFLDASWRVFIGQVPYIDFYYTTGPIHLYMNVLFFKLFGFGTQAILWHIIIISSIVIIATFLAIHRSLPTVLTAFITFLAASGFYIAHPHPWYIYSAHFWGVIGFAYLLWVVPIENKRVAFSAGILCSIMGFMSFMTKSDVGLAHGAAFFVILMFGRFRLKAVAGFTLGILMSVIVFSLFMSPVSYYQNAMADYGFGATRQLKRFYYWPTLLKNYYWLPAVMIPIILGRSRRDHRQLFVLFLAIGISALFSLNIGSLRGTEHIPIMGIYLGAGFILLKKGLRLTSVIQRRRAYYVGFVIMILLTGFQIKRSFGKGLEYLHSNVHSPTAVNRLKQGDYQLQAKPLAGWHLDHESGEMLDDMVNFVNQYVRKDDSFLVLTKLQILYALTERDSFRGVPFLWHPGQLPAPGKQREAVRDLIKSDPPQWIMTNREKDIPINRMFVVLELKKPFLDKYVKVKSWGDYYILRRNN